MFFPFAWGPVGGVVQASATPIAGEVWGAPRQKQLQIFNGAAPIPQTPEEKVEAGCYDEFRRWLASPFGTLSFLT